MGNRFAAQELKNRAISQIYGDMFGRDKLAADTSHRSDKLDIDREYLKLSAEKNRLDKLRIIADLMGDEASRARVKAETGMLNRKLDALDRNKGVGDPADMDVADQSLLNMRPHKPNKPYGELTENQRILLEMDAAEMEQDVINNLDDPAQAGNISFVNRYSNNPYFYVQEDVQGTILWIIPTGKEVKGRAIDLPKDNDGRQITSTDVHFTAEEEGKKVEEILKGLEVI